MQRTLAWWCKSIRPFEHENDIYNFCFTFKNLRIKLKINTFLLLLSSFSRFFSSRCSRFSAPSRTLSGSLPEPLFSTITPSFLFYLSATPLSTLYLHFHPSYSTRLHPCWIKRSLISSCSSSLRYFQRNPQYSLFIDQMEFQCLRLWP